MEEITVSEGSERSSFITYLYNGVMSETLRLGGRGELMFTEGRVAMRLTPGRDEERLTFLVREKLAEVVAVGYKYSFLSSRLAACLSRREKKLLLAALIAADYEGDVAFIKGEMPPLNHLCIDGFYNFRLKSLREKWRRILEYIPTAFSSEDLQRFCDFLVGESKHKIYVKGNAVFGENLTPLKRSRLTGEEDVETEIMLSDAGFVYCLGEVEESVGKFLQKYYAERAIFS